MSLLLAMRPERYWAGKFSDTVQLVHEDDDHIFTQDKADQQFQGDEMLNPVHRVIMYWICLTHQCNNHHCN